jgi:hypothetical protein
VYVSALARVEYELEIAVQTVQSRTSKNKPNAALQFYCKLQDFWRFGIASDDASVEVCFVQPKCCNLTQSCESAGLFVCNSRDRAGGYVWSHA